MQYTVNLNMKKPDPDDPVFVEDLDENFDTLDEEIEKKADKTGDASSMIVNFVRAATRVNVVGGETLGILFGKVSRWFADLKEHCFLDLVTDVSSTSTTRALAANVGNFIQDELDTFKANFLAGLAKIAGAISSGTDRAAGIATASNASPQTMADNIGKACIRHYDQGVTDARVGTAQGAQVLEGYTFTNYTASGLNGAMPNNGALNWKPQGIEVKNVASGYYSGGKLDSTDAYNNGRKSALVGTAQQAHVLEGKTFTNSTAAGLSGSMKNQGTLNWVPGGEATKSISAGYYSGGTLDSRKAYEAGYKAAREQLMATFWPNIVQTDNIFEGSFGTSPEVPGLFEYKTLKTIRLIKRLFIIARATATVTCAGTTVRDYMDASWHLYVVDNVPAGTEISVSNNKELLFMFADTLTRYN